MQPRSILINLHAASDTLPNLKHWHIQCGAKCTLCGCTQPTTAHVLGGCPSALTQGCFTYCHNKVLHCLTTELTNFFSELSTVSVYADLLGMRASDSPQTTIPPYLLTTPYQPDIVLYNEGNNSIVLLELTCPLYSVEHLNSARDRKQGKREYQELQSEFNRLGLPCFYDTIELSILGHCTCHYLCHHFRTVLTLFKVRLRLLNLPARYIFDLAATASISSSRIFLARDFPEWSGES